MRSRRARAALRIYRGLLMVLPETFRRRHGAEMEAIFSETLDGLSGSPFGRLTAWSGAVRDLLAVAVATRAGTAAARGRPIYPRKQERNMIDSIVADVRHAVRGLLRTPSFAVVAVLTIGLGIGATTLVFSVVHGVLLRPLPYADADRLVNVWNDLVEERQYLPAVNPADFRDYQTMSETFEEFAAASGGQQVGVSGVLTGDGPPEHVDVSSVTHNFLSLLGITPILGRHFDQGEETFNGPNVVIISHALWQQRYGADSAIVGGSVQLDGAPHTVVGVLPRDFRLLLPAEAFLVRHADVWVPLQVNYSNLPPRNWTYFTVLGRLREGVTVERAQADMDRVAEELRATYPEHVTSGMQIRLVPFQHDIVKRAQPTLWILFGAVGFVLLIACVNVAHLMLLRSMARQREVAMRTALGAGRGRIVQQILTESLVVGFFGAALGLGLTQLGLAALVAFPPPSLPRSGELGIDGMVLGFTIFASVAASVVFGLVPALHAGRTDVTGLLREGGRAGGSRSAAGIRTALVVGEVALSVVLLVGTGLLVKSFIALQGVRPGFEPDGALTFTLSLPGTDYPGGQAVMDFMGALEPRLTAIPGVAAVGGVSQLPLTGPGPLWPYAYDDATAADFNLTAEGRIITPGYFEAMGTRLVAGRFFDERDRVGAGRSVIIEEMLARRAWPDGDAVGRQLQLSQTGQNRTATVVGVVEHIRVYDLARDVREQIYEPHGQRPTRTLSIAVRAASGTDPAELAAAVRQEVWALDPNLPIDDLRPLGDYVADAMADSRLSLIVMSVFGGIALVLASVGTYGVISYAVDQRAREFGIRIALGAQPSRLVRSVVASSLRLVALSVGVGIAISLGVTRVMSGLLYNVSPADVTTHVVAALALLGVAMLACYLPARRTAAADPVAALRIE